MPPPSPPGAVGPPPAPAVQLLTVDCVSVAVPALASAPPRPPAKSVVPIEEPPPMPATSPVKSRKLPVKTPPAATKTPPPSPPRIGVNSLPFQAWQLSNRLDVKVASPRTFRQPPFLSTVDFALAVAQGEPGDG